MINSLKKGQPPGVIPTLCMRYAWAIRKAQYLILSLVGETKIL